MTEAKVLNVNALENKLTDKIPKCLYPFKSRISDAEFYTSPLHKPPFEHALDIASPEGEEILCPVGGKIIDLRQYSTQWIPYSKDSGDPNKTLNWITIQVYERQGLLRRSFKRTPWIVQLCHIKAYSVQEKVGEFVEKGKFLAKVGLNGMISTTKGIPDSHLHIVVGRGKSEEDPFTNFQSYPLSFQK